MKLKIFNLLIIVVFSKTIIQAQDYLINFTGSGAATTVTSVKIENLTQGTSIEMSGTNVLHLVNSITGIEKVEMISNGQVTFYPNPMSDYTRMQFKIPEDGNANIYISDISGRNILQIQEHLDKGENVYRLQGIENGIYVATIRFRNITLNGRFISISSKNGTARIFYENSLPQERTDTPKNYEKNVNSKSALSEVLMQYNTGDRLKFTGVSGNYSTVVVDIPTESKIINYEFLPCTDGDGNHYPNVKIGTQIWMAENLKTTKYIDGSLIPNITDNTWSGLSAPAFCWYDNDIGYKNTYGALYNWYAVSTGKICPIGWHVPSDYEWGNTLLSALGDNPGNKLKEPGSIHWHSNTDATNETGFTGLPGGVNAFGFTGLRNTAIFWSSTGSGTSGQSFELDGIYTYLHPFKYNAVYGCSVRCIKNQSKNEEAFPGNEGEIKKVAIAGDTITCKLADTILIFQGDIILTRNQLEFNKGTALASISDRWPNGVVYFKISPDMPANTKDYIYSAIADYEDNTRIRFVERTNENNYVEFVDSETFLYGIMGTCSRIGMTGGHQRIWLEPSWNSVGEIIHEIGHTIGLVHEQSRADRDDWVNINWDNIKSSKKQDYEIAKNSFYTGVFDFNSIMLFHGQNSSDAIDISTPVITNKITGESYTANRIRLSDSDIEMVNTLYRAPEINAAFSASKTTIFTSEIVLFSDQSTNEPTSWFWNFGDGKTSLEQNPKHVYESSGKFTVTLKAYNKFDSNTLTKTEYINVFNEKQLWGGEVQSKIDFKYGRFEVRMRPAKKSGVINSFFTYLSKNDSQEEIDIEFVGNTNAEFTFHFPDETESNKNVPGVSTFIEGFSVYRFDWTDNYIEWYINNTLVHKITNEQVNNHLSDLIDKQYILMNIWSHINNWGGSLDISSLPICVEYDWIKYYTWDKTSGMFSSTPDWQDDFNNLDNWIISKSTFSDSAADFVPENVRQVTKFGNGYLVLFLSQKGITIPDPAWTGTFIDGRDNVEYKWVKIGNQIWMAENLKSTQYNDGTEIPNVLGSWENLTTPSYCWYNNMISNKDIYGAMYNWYALNTGKLCPVGWHVPHDDEWTILINYAGGEISAGDRLKESGTMHWTNPNTEATNEFGFAALPGGYYRYGNFIDIGNYGMWWSSTSVYPYSKWMRHMYYAYPGVYRGQKDPRDGYSVRCIKN